MFKELEENERGGISEEDEKVRVEEGAQEKMSDEEFMHGCRNLTDCNCTGKNNNYVISFNSAMRKKNERRMKAYERMRSFNAAIGRKDEEERVRSFSAAMKKA